MRPCPSCAVFATAAATAQPLRFIAADGVAHVLPAAWLSGRRQQLEREGLAPVVAMRAAYLQWAAACAAGTAADGRRRGAD